MPQAVEVLGESEKEGLSDWHDQAQVIGFGIELGISTKRETRALRPRKRFRDEGSRLTELGERPLSVVYWPRQIQGGSHESVISP